MNFATYAGLRPPKTPDGAGWCPENLFTGAKIRVFEHAASRSEASTCALKRVKELDKI